jgi:hypothetical protein
MYMGDVLLLRMTAFVIGSSKSRINGHDTWVSISGSMLSSGAKKKSTVQSVACSIQRTSYTDFFNNKSSPP